MFGLHFNPFTSKTIQGAVVALATYVVAHPHLTLADVFPLVGVLWSVIGVRDAIAKATP